MTVNYGQLFALLIMAQVFLGKFKDEFLKLFFTTKPVGKGTGLGLAISHQIITENHQGKLNVRSQSNKIEEFSPSISTEFEMLLPLA